MKYIGGYGFAAAAIAVLAGFAGSSNAAEPRNIAIESNICREIITSVERAARIPAGILQAISLAESGRWDKKSRSHFAWPWTVTAHGKGRFYPSKQAAIAAVRTLQADGVKNIDVGCMQVNLKYHPTAFASLDEALDPAANARYAAALFSKLRVANRSISRAIAHYHSTTRSLNRPYSRKVIKLWNKERRRYYAERRAKKLADWHAKRAQRKNAQKVAVR